MSLSMSGEWVMLDEGVGYNQYDPFLPHARYKHAGAPLSDTMFVFFGGCARYIHSYSNTYRILIRSIAVQNISCQKDLLLYYINKPFINQLSKKHTSHFYTSFFRVI